MRVDKSWPVRVCSENNNCMRVDWILQHVARTLINFHQNLNQLNTLMRVKWILASAAKTLMNSTQNLKELKVDES